MPANRPSYLTNANRGASRNGMTTAVVAVMGSRSKRPRMAPQRPVC